MGPRTTWHQDDSAVVELRQYTHHPGTRDTLIALFESSFVPRMETLGMRVLAHFRDADDPNRFVWMRGYPRMAERKAMCEAFYGDPVWLSRRDAANATLVDTDDVLLMKPSNATSSFLLAPERGAVAPLGDGGMALLTTWLFTAPVDEDFVRFFETRAVPILERLGGPSIGRFRTDGAKNDFPRHPIREGENAFVWLSTFASAAELDGFVARLEADPAWTTTVMAAVTPRLASSPRRTRLVPTARSRVRHVPLPDVAPPGDARDFDFLAGAWSVRNERLTARGTDVHTWEEFASEATETPYLGGIANVEEMTFASKGTIGMAVRNFDRAARRWSITWISSTDGALCPPVHGGFDGDRGVFYGEDEDGGENVRVRFVWTRMGEDAARWEQAFSVGGAAWRTNWVMRFTRRS